METSQVPLPHFFLWTRMGVEAGETLVEIVERKERERLATGGIFLWGIGNSVGAAAARLAAVEAGPVVLFSPTHSHPRAIDTAPDTRVIWTGAVTRSGEPYAIPRGVRVMGGVVDSRRIPPRYALVCWTDQPLALGEHGAVRLSELRNLVSGRPVGASQVTAVVERERWVGSHVGRAYAVAMRAALVPPYVVRLVDPIVVEDRRPAALKSVVPRAEERELLGGHPQLSLPGFVRVPSSG